ncbi:hypothetical protein B0T20DRAFT_64357 [Sordaria brevicollis]|uniref:Uncharacterized protein n=1 Tax=Sordaria brevicollis TaxID=83679 RepID=A0AAE0U5V7_SORBR|nr:hypothetical protein B0T20DRAFT_64357 [Sordaria brevicollis]
MSQIFVSLKMTLSRSLVLLSSSWASGKKDFHLLWQQAFLMSKGVLVGVNSMISYGKFRGSAVHAWSSMSLHCHFSSSQTACVESDMLNVPARIPNILRMKNPEHS